VGLESSFDSPYVFHLGLGPHFEHNHVEAKIIRDNVKGSSKGYGFVKFYNINFTSQIIAHMNGYGLVYKNTRKKKAFVPPPHFINMREVKEMHIPVEHKRDPVTGEVFETIEGMMFKDAYVFKIASMKSISSQIIQPTFVEL